MLPIHTILHPTDFSDSSGNALKLACALARDYGARLVVLHVANPPTVVFGEGIVPPEPVAYFDQERRHLQQLALPDATVRVERRFTEGDAAKEILGAARETHADLIVMGTHGRTGLRRLLMGSVAEKVVRRSPCPVLTVKTPFPEEGMGAPVDEEMMVAAGI